LSTLA